MKPNVPSSDGFFVLAEAYCDAADAVIEKIRSGGYCGMAVTPLVFLCFRSIELSLKAVLVHHGKSKKSISKLGHRLGSLLDSCDSLPDLNGNLDSIGMNPQSESLLRNYSDTYSDKWFEYSDDFWKEPDIGVLHQTCQKICGKVRSYR